MQQPAEDYLPNHSESVELAAALAAKVRSPQDTPLDELRRRVVLLGGTGLPQVAAAPLLAILGDSANPLRADALWGLRALSGKDWGDDFEAWRAWWQETQARMSLTDPSRLPAEFAVEPRPVPHSEDQPAVGVATLTPTRAVPWQTVAAGIVSGLGGVWGIAAAVYFSFRLEHFARFDFFEPIMAVLFLANLLVGTLTLACVAGQNWKELKGCAKVQMATFCLCDAVQSASGLIATILLTRTDAKRYLNGTEVNQTSGTGGN